MQHSGVPCVVMLVLGLGIALIIELFSREMRRRDMVTWLLGSIGLLIMLGVRSMPIVCHVKENAIEQYRPDHIENR